MYSRLIFVNKIKPDSLLEVQTFNNNHFFFFLQIGHLFGVSYKEEKPGDFSLPQNGRTKTWCIGTDKSYCMSENFPKAM